MELRSVRFIGVQWAAIALMAGLVHAPVAAQAWTQVATTGPAPRMDHAMAYDIQRGRAVLFGGLDAGYVVVGYTSEWDGSTWTQVGTTGPQARHRHAMAYDSLRGRTVLFGGHGSGNYHFGDTWEWDGSAWTRVSTTGPSRAHHAMAHDSQRGKTVLFGGRLGNYLGDTWEWDGSAWTQVGATGPAPRTEHAMAYDIQRGRTVLFGGWDGTSYLGDTWEWDGSAWTQLSAAGPAARGAFGMAHDHQRGRTVLYGGFTYNVPSNFLRDTWEWDGSAWTQVGTIGPSFRCAHAMVYDSLRSRTLMFGGVTFSVPRVLRDTWEWTGGLASTATTFGSGCGNPALVLSPVATARPTIGTTAQASLANIPSTLAFVMGGWSQSQLSTSTLPLSLAPYGMPGCDLLQSKDATAQVAIIASGTGTFSLAVPNWSGLVGLHLYLQGWAYSPASGGHLIVSNGVEWVVGNS